MEEYLKVTVDRVDYFVWDIISNFFCDNYTFMEFLTNNIDNKYMKKFLKEQGFYFDGNEVTINMMKCDIYHGDLTDYFKKEGFEWFASWDKENNNEDSDDDDNEDEWNDDNDYYWDDEEKEEEEWNDEDDEED